MGVRWYSGVGVRWYSVGVRWYSADPCTILYNPRQWEYGGIQWEYGGIHEWEYGGIQWEYGGIQQTPVQPCTISTTAQYRHLEMGAPLGDGCARPSQPMCLEGKQTRAFY